MKSDPTSRFCPSLVSLLIYSQQLLFPLASRQNIRSYILLLLESLRRQFKLNEPQSKVREDKHEPQIIFSISNPKV